MTMQSEEKELRQRMGRLETLLQEIEGFGDPAVRDKARQLVQMLLEYHGTGLARILDYIAQAGEAGQPIIDAIAQDELVGNLLLLYELHPLSLETRIGLALESVRPYLRSHGGNIELLGIGEGVVRLRMQGSCHGCPSSAMTLKLAVEEAIYAKAPDVVGIEVEGVVEPPTPTKAEVGFVPVEQVLKNGHRMATSSGWEEITDRASLSDGSVATRQLSGRPVLFCQVGPTLYAYASTCPNCGQSLQQAKLVKHTLTCPACGHQYDVAGAGRDIDASGHHLEPFPLLEEHGHARVALPHG